MHVDEHKPVLDLTKARDSALWQYNLEKWTQYTAEELIPGLLIPLSFSHCLVSLVPGLIDNCTCFCFLGSVERFPILAGYLKKLIFIILYHTHTHTHTHIYIYIYISAKWITKTTKGYTDCYVLSAWRSPFSLYPTCDATSQWHFPK